MLKMNLELKGVDKFLEELDAKKFKQAMRSTVDKTATFAKKALADEIVSEYNVKRGDVLNKMTVKRTTINELRSILRITSAKFSKIYFNARQTGRGVLANISRKKIEFMPSAFIQTMKTGHRDVFKRKTKNRFPIKVMKGPSVPDLAKAIEARVKDKINNFMRTTFKNEIEKRKEK